MAPAKPRLLVVEDDEAIRTAVDTALRQEGFEVRALDQGAGIENVALQFRPDLAILDVRLPRGPDGYTIARRLRLCGDFPILFLTSADTHEDRRSGFEAGADDYLAKPFSMEELLWRIRAVLRRSGRLTSQTSQIGDLVLVDKAQTVVRDCRLLDLTRTEYQLLAVLARHPGQVLSKTQLLTQVWGYEAYDANLV